MTRPITAVSNINVIARKPSIVGVEKADKGD